MPYRSGDHYVICDRTGFKIRASEVRREWTGSLVRSKSWEARHPQDFLRGKPDKMDVGETARPEPVLNFMGPLTTTLTVAAAAGATSITVNTTKRFIGGDRIRIRLENSEMFLTGVSIVTSDTTLYLDNPLPYSAAVGALVVNLTAVSEPQIG